MDEAELIKLIKLSLPTLVVVIVILFFLTVFKAKWASDRARNAELDNEQLRKEMELLARNKIAQRAADNPESVTDTPTTVSSETLVAASESPEKVPVDKVDIGNKEINKDTEVTENIEEIEDVGDISDIRDVEDVEDVEDKQENNVSDGFIEGEPLA